jgi:hypothetical protein
VVIPLVLGATALAPLLVAEAWRAAEAAAESGARGSPKG